MTRKATERAVSRRGFIKDRHSRPLQLRPEPAPPPPYSAAPLRAHKARGSSRRRGRMVSSPTRFPRREKSSGRAAATAALLHAPQVPRRRRHPSLIDNDTDGDDEFGGVSFRSCLKLVRCENGSTAPIASNTP